MSFRSILFPKMGGRAGKATAEAPIFFRDLNLDQIVENATATKAEYDLKPFFYAPLNDLDSIAYRHEVFRDLEDPALLHDVREFAGKMREMREHLARAGKLYYRYQKEGWFLDAVEIYCGAIVRFRDDVARNSPQSRGLRCFREYLNGYIHCERFASLVAELQAVKAGLRAIRYSMLIKGDQIKVRKYESESDYCAGVEETFGKFQQGAAKDYRIEFANPIDMNHIEAGVLTLVAQLYPEAFQALDRYCADHAGYLDDIVREFDRQMQFYIAYLEHISPLRSAGMQFCYPHLSKSKQVRDLDCFDLALAHKLVVEKGSVVRNDFFLTAPERIIVVSGPNQGGKTTFARMFGQLHYLASLGCPVPGTDAALFLFDQIFTHFERQESIGDLRGKLEDDLVRLRDALARATPDSIIILNEIFTSTTLKDAAFLTRKAVERIMGLEALCVCVTFIDELASLSDTTVSMVSTVVPENPAMRTYKIVRRPADGLAYAMAIADKHGLTYDRLRERIGA